MRDTPRYQASAESHENHDEEPEVPAKDALGGRQGKQRAVVIDFTLRKIYIKSCQYLIKAGANALEKHMAQSTIPFAFPRADGEGAFCVTRIMLTL
jgi:hypothetical protein